MTEKRFEATDRLQAKRDLKFKLDKRTMRKRFASVQNSSQDPLQLFYLLAYRRLWPLQGHLKDEFSNQMKNCQKRCLTGPSCPAAGKGALLKLISRRWGITGERTMPKSTQQHPSILLPLLLLSPAELVSFLYVAMVCWFFLSATTTDLLLLL